MTPSAATRADLLMLRGVTATCADCGDRRLFVPVDDPGPGDEFCCTSCDAAVFLVTGTTPVRTDASRVA